MILRYLFRCSWAKEAEILEKPPPDRGMAFIDGEKMPRKAEEFIFSSFVALNGVNSQTRLDVLRDRAGRLQKTN